MCACHVNHFVCVLLESRDRAEVEKSDWSCQVDPAVFSPHPSSQTEHAGTEPLQVAEREETRCVCVCVCVCVLWRKRV